MLAAARILVIAGPQANVVSRIGGAVPADKPGPPAAESPEASKSVVAARVGSMVERVARHTWWRSMCLEKAIAGRWMLKHRGIRSTMYVGVAKDGGAFIAHAWLVGEGQTVTGAGNKSYATLAAFRER